MHQAQEHDRVLLISPDRKQYIISLQRGMRFHTHKGIVDHDDLIGQPLGREIRTHLNHSFMVLRPSLHDILMNVKRVSQIIYPKEIGVILLKLDVSSGRRVIEAGTGSGALTIALANAVRPAGKVYSYELREEMLRIARENVDTAGLSDYVSFHHSDIADGFEQSEVDALFLDVREPWCYLDRVCPVLADGGFFGALVPTTNQVSDLLAGMTRYPLTGVDVMEVLIRRYKPVPQRLRPRDVMVGHTGYLVFARKISKMLLDPRREKRRGSRNRVRI